MATRFADQPSDAGVSSTDPVARARALRPLFAENAAACEREGRIPDVVMAALREAELFHITAPLRVGGPAVNLITHIETVAEIAKGCVGTAWAYGLISGVTGTAKGMAPEVTELLFRTGDELMCSATAMTGTADPVEGGYIVSGRWPYGSGCLHSDWGLNGVLIRNAEGEIVDSAFAFIDLKDPATTILDNWHVAGMAGSGSCMIVSEKIFVPDALFLKTSDRPSHEALLAIEGLEDRDHWPWESLFPLGVLAPMLGAAEAILETVTAKMEKRPVTGWTYPNQKDSEMLLGQLGEAALEIDSAWMHIRRATSSLDEIAPKRPLTGYEKARNQADCGYAMGLLRAAGNRLMDVAGPGAFALDNPLQRFWRDLNVGTRHNALNRNFSIELLGRAMTGADSNLLLLPEIGPKP